MKKLITILFLALLFMFSNLMAQNNKGKEKKKNEKRTNYQEQYEGTEEDSVRRWEYGLNFGAYFPDKYPANFYNGAPENINNANYVLSNRYWYNDIKKALNASDTIMIQRYTISTGSDGYPRNMHYTVSFYGGIFVRMNFNKKNALFIQANYTRLTASDVLVFEIDPPASPQTWPKLSYQTIVGKEGRVLMDLGYQRSIPTPSKIFFYIQGAVTMSYTQVLKSFFEAGGVQYDMINIYDPRTGYIPGANSQTYNVYQNAFGFGGYLGAGAGIPLTPVFGIEPGFFMQYYPVNLENYKAFKPSYGLTLRLMINFQSQEENQ